MLIVLEYVWKPSILIWDGTEPKILNIAMYQLNKKQLLQISPVTQPCFAGLGMM